MPKARASASAGTTVESTVRSRALSERMYLLSRLPVSEQDVEATFLVSGQSGLLYTVRLPINATSPRPRCNCPDHLIRKRACKHLLFVALRVLKLQPRRHNNNIYNTSNNTTDEITLNDLSSLYEQISYWSRHQEQQVHGEDMNVPGEVQRAFQLIVPQHMHGSTTHHNHHHHSSSPVEKKHVHIDDECPICFEVLLPDPLLFCRIGCGNAVHESCMRTYATACAKQDGVKCVLCRAQWHFEKGVDNPTAGLDIDLTQGIPHRGVLENGRLIDLSVLASSSFTPGSRQQRYSRSYEIEEDEDEDEGDVECIGDNGNGESQSEKMARQKSERAERARKREQQQSSNVGTSSSVEINEEGEDEIVSNVGTSRRNRTRQTSKSKSKSRKVVTTKRTTKTTTNRKTGSVRKTQTTNKANTRATRGKARVTKKNISANVDNGVRRSTRVRTARTVM